MRNQSMVTIIVPVYNVERYLAECVESILAQTYENIEIILVNDGSTDGSGRLCDRFEKEDDRILVIHKENGGLSDARNTGLAMAHGEYISFIDSDDFISPVFVEAMVNEMWEKNAEIAALKRGTDFWDGEPAVDLNCDLKAVTGEEFAAKSALEEMLYHKIATGAPFKIYSRKLWDDVRFPKGYLYEDVATTYKTFLKAKKVVVLDEDFYAYRKRKDSIIRREFNEDKMICLKIADQLLGDIKEKVPDLLPAAYSRVFSMVFSVYLQVPEEDEKNRELLWMWLIANRKFVLKNHDRNVRKKNKYGAYVTYFGKNVTAKIGRKFGQRKSRKK